MTLVTRTAIAVAAVSVLLLVVMGTAAFIVVRGLTIDAGQQVARANIQQVATEIITRLDGLDARARALSQNLVIRNAILDSIGRTAYVEPFLQSEVQTQGQAVGVAIVDFQGEPIASAGEGMVFSARETAWLLRVLADGLPDLVHDESPGLRLTHLLLAYPLAFPATDSVEGALVYRITIGGVIPDTEAATLKYFLVRARQSGRGEQGHWQPSSEGVLFPLRLTLAGKPADIALSAAVDDSFVGAAVRRLQLTYLAIGAIALALVVGTSIAVARRVVRPLRDMATVAGRIASTSAYEEAELLPRQAGGEIGALAKSFAEMLDRLHAAAELERQNREARFRAIFEAVSEAVISVDAAGMIESVNPAAEHLFGYSAEQMLGRNVSMLMPEPMRSEHDGYIERYLRTGEARIIGAVREVPGLHKWGREIPLELSISRATVDKKPFFTGILRDITERKEAQAALRHAQEELRKLALVASRTSNAVIITDRHGRFEWVNEGFTRLSGYTLEETFGRTPDMLVGPETDPRVVEEIRQNVIAGTPFRGELVNYHKDGHPYWLEMDGQPIYEDGKLIHFVAIESDITERRQATEALRVSEERLRTVLSNTPIVIVAMDAHGIVTLSEGQGLVALNREPGELVGKSIFDFLEDQPDLKDAVQSALEGTPQSVEYTVRRSDLQGHVAPIVDYQQQAGAILVAYDITERKRVEQMKAEFVSTVSHELRTPLASIVGYVDVLIDEDAGPINEEQREFLQIVSSNALRLTALISDLLDIEKLEAGKIQMEQGEVDLELLLRNVAQTFRIMAEGKGLTLKTDIAQGLTLIGDENRLIQVFSNLVSNAVKYTREGQVTISAARDGDAHVVHIKDTGIGLARDSLEKLFTRFFRADDEYTRAAGGTGLGLAISKAIVEHHGGQIEVSSKVDAGSAFTVRLPLKPPEAVA